MEFLPPVWKRCKIVFFLQKILLSQPFTKADHQRKFLPSNNVTKTFMEECIHREFGRGDEEEASENVSNAQARGYSFERLRKMAFFGPKLRRFGRAPANLSLTPRGATGEFLAQNLDLARPPPKLYDG